MRQFCQHIDACGNSLTLFNQWPTVNWELYFGYAAEAQICASLTLAYALAIAKKRPWPQAETVSVKLQDHIVLLIGLYPQPAAGPRCGLVTDRATKIHYLALDGASRCISTEFAYLDEDFVSLSVKRPFVGQAYFDNCAIDRADDAEGNCGNDPMGISKYQ